MTFRDACLQLGITEDNLYNDDSDAEDTVICIVITAIVQMKKICK